MNILLINHYAGSPKLGMEYRPYYLANEWQRSGHKVLIVMASNTHFRSYQIQTEKKIENQNIEGINYCIIKSPPYTGHTLKRVINIIVFVWRLFKYRKKIVLKFNPDVVIASSTYVFDIYPAKRIAKISNAKLFFEVHDLWPLSPMELGGYSKWHPYIFVMQKAEDYAYKYANKVISLLPNAIDYMREHGLKENNFIYIPNGINIEEWKINEKIPGELDQLIRELKNQNKILIGYVGTHGLANALDSLVHSMKILETQNVELLLIGKGTEKDNLILLSEKLKLKNVHFINSVPKSLIPSILKKIDILFIGLQNQPLFRFGISPNKLIDYMMAGKPIIQAIKAGNDMVLEAGCGVSIEPENSEAIAEAVKKLIALPKINLQEMGENGKKYCIRNHDFRLLAKKYIEAI